MTCLVFVYELIPSGEDVSCESADLDTKVERVRKKRSMFEKVASADSAPTSLSRKVNLLIQKKNKIDLPQTKKYSRWY